MFLASNCTCVVYVTYTAHVPLLTKSMAATHVHAICTRICIRNQTSTLRFCREDNPLYVFTHAITPHIGAAPVSESDAILKNILEKN